MDTLTADRLREVEAANLQADLLVRMGANEDAERSSSQGQGTRLRNYVEYRMAIADLDRLKEPKSR